MRNSMLISIIMWALITQLCIAQTSLVRTVINVPATPGEPQDPPHPGVDMVAGPNRIRFDTWYAGVPRYWHQDGEPNGSSTSIIYPNMGAAMTPVAVTGQDATFSTANGVDRNPLTRFDDPVGTAKYNYYARETVFQPPTELDPRAIYETTGFGPFFWVSDDRAEDAVPDGAIDHWCNWTCQGANGVFPVTFKATGGNTSSMLFIANAAKPIHLSWNQRLAEIPQGRVATKTTIDLTQGSANCFAAIVFRKHIPTNGAPGLGEAFGAAGYMLAFNRLGTVALHRLNGGGGNEIVGSWPNAAPLAATKEYQLEVRTHNAPQLAGLIQLYIDDVLLAEWIDPNPILGPHFGYFAFTEAGSLINVHRRMVYDVGMEFVNRYEGYPDGTVISDIRVRNAPFVSEPREFLGSDGLPAPQWNPYYATGGHAPLNAIAPLNRCGAPLAYGIDIASCVQTCDTPAPPLPPGQGGFMSYCLFGSAARSGYTAWHGNVARSRGLYMTPLVVEVDAEPSPESHASSVQIQGGPAGVFPKAGVAPIPFIQVLFNCPGFVASEQRVVTAWTLPPPLFESLSTADLNDDCTVDGADLGILLGSWGGGAGSADLDSNGDVDGVDLGLLLASWGDGA